ncbi:MAG: GIY-YIG nuclease family protein, partial [Pseudomonadota bacterium]
AFFVYIHAIRRRSWMVTVYVLRGETGKRYVGITNDLNRRLSEHLKGHSKGSQVIGKFHLLHTETFEDYKDARTREKFLKSGQGRKWLDEFETKSEPATNPAGKASF